MWVVQDALAHLCSLAARELETRTAASHGTGHVRSNILSRTQQQIKQELLTAERVEENGPREEVCTDDETLGELELNQECGLEMGKVKNEFGS